MTRMIARILGSALLCATFSAHASFHTWVINELYSDASGTIQFVEFRESAGFDGQSVLAGHTLTSTRGAIVQTFTFPTNLPGPGTALRNFLVGTQDYANLNVAAPDYIIPNGFLFIDGGALDFAAVDNVVYGALPIDGVLSIDRTGVAAVNSPTDFAGNTGSISPPPPPSPPLPNQAGASPIPTVSPAMLLLIAGLIGLLVLFPRRALRNR